jgi:hypothetical protein
MDPRRFLLFPPVMEWGPVLFPLLHRAGIASRTDLQCIERWEHWIGARIHWIQPLLQFFMAYPLNAKANLGS